MTSKNIYKEVNPNPNFAEVEEGVLAYWKANDTFKKLVDGVSGNLVHAERHPGLDPGSSS